MNPQPGRKPQENEALERMADVVRGRLRVGFLTHAQPVKKALQALSRDEPAIGLQSRQATEGDEADSRILQAAEEAESGTWQALMDGSSPQSPWSDLVHRAGLSARELSLIALLFFIETDTEFARAFSHVSLDYGHPHPSIQSLRSLFGDDTDALAGPGGRLRSLLLIEPVVLTESNLGDSGRRFSLPASLVAFLTSGHYPIDDALASVIRREGPASRLVRPPKELVGAITTSLTDFGAGVLALVGPLGHDPIALVADATGGEPLGLCLKADTSDGVKTAVGQLAVAVRNGLLSGRSVVVELGSQLLGEQALIDALIHGTKWLERPLFVAVRKAPSPFYGRLEVREVFIPNPSDAFRLKLLVRSLPQNVTIEDAEGIDAVVRSLAIPPDLLVAAVEQSASDLRLNRKKGRGPRPLKKDHSLLHLSRERLAKAMRTQLTTTIGDYAHVVTVSQGWDDLQLDEAQKEPLREVVTAYRHRNQVLGAWGFGHHATGGLGITSLFYGPPGTGKTMAAGIVAAELGLEIYRIDLSRVVDKYIGETEKALAKVFDEAERGEVVLLFDEADSLFGKRTEVKSSTDRYGNLEVNYLLQRMEAYDGVVILTTNHQAHLDPAFKRRLRYQIHFAMPAPEQRQGIWQRLIPDEAPLAGEIDFEELAHRFEISGGHIRNAVLTAAILGARDGAEITQAHLIAGGNREYRALGKLVREIE